MGLPHGAEVFVSRWPPPCFTLQSFYQLQETAIPRPLLRCHFLVCSTQTKALVASIVCEGELGIVALEICRSLPRIVILGDIPNHNIMLWDWSTKVRASIRPQNSPAPRRLKRI